MLEQSGANRFALEAESAVRGDAYRIMAFSLLGVAGIFLLFFRSPRALVLALAACPRGRGRQHGDLHRGVRTRRRDDRRLRRLPDRIDDRLPGARAQPVEPRGARHLGLGDRSRAARLARRWRRSPRWRASSVSRSRSSRASASSACSRRSASRRACSRRCTCCRICFRPGAPCRRSRRALPHWLAASVLGLRTRRRWLALLPIGAALFGAVALPRLVFVDDLARLGEPAPALLAEEQRVRERVSSFDSGRLVVALADDPAEAIARNERCTRGSRREIAAGHLAGMRSLHALLWSSRSSDAISRAARPTRRCPCASTPRSSRPASARVPSRPSSPRSRAPAPLTLDGAARLAARRARLDARDGPRRPHRRGHLSARRFATPTRCASRSTACPTSTGSSSACS